MHWRALRESDLVAVCSWHDIDIQRQRKAHLERLYEVRAHVKALGPIDELLAPSHDDANDVTPPTALGAS